MMLFKIQISTIDNGMRATHRAAAPAGSGQSRRIQAKPKPSPDEPICIGVDGAVTRFVPREHAQ
jgi:hypothetical protein